MAKLKAKKNLSFKKRQLPNWFHEPHLGRIVDIFILILGYLYFSKLLQWAAKAVIFTDECFYALLSEYVSEFHFPMYLKGLFSEQGHLVTNPPLLFMLAGLLKILCGSSIFNFFNVLMNFITIGIIYFYFRKQNQLYYGRLAILILFSSELFFSQSLRFYAEILTAFTFLTSLFTLYHALYRPHRYTNLICAISFCCFMLSKQTGVLTFPILAITFFWCLWNKEFVQSKTVLKISLWTLFLFSPYHLYLYSVTGNLIPWFKIFGSTPITYPVVEELKNAPDYWQKNKWRELYAAFKGYGPIILMGFLACITWAVQAYRQHTLKDKKWIFIWINIIFSMLLFAYHGNTETRHFTQFIPLLSILCSIAILELIQNLRFFKLTLILIMSFIWLYNCFNLSHYPNFRQYFDLPRQFQPALQFLKEKTPQDSKVMSIWGFELLYYARRKHIFPFSEFKEPDNPWELSLNKGKDYFYKNLKKYNVNYIFIDKTRVIPMYMLNMHPKYTIEFINELISDGKAKMVYDNQGVAIIQFL